MGFLGTLAIALKALATNKLRSGLTMLGIVIGVAAVIAMIAIGRGAQQSVAEQLAGLGSNIIVVWPASASTGGLRLGASTAPTLSQDDAEAIAREVPGVLVSAPLLRGNQQIVVGNQNWQSAVHGITNDYLVARDWVLASGRVFESSELGASGKVAIIGATVARELFGDSDPIDQPMRIGRLPVTVIGVLAPKGQSAWGNDQDDIVMVPISTMRNRIQGQPTGRLQRVGSISIKAASAEELPGVMEAGRALLRQRHHLQAGQEDDFRMRNLTEIAETREEASETLAWLLAAVAGVSLLVGGIGIMNIMLVSVTERTREIGLRRAVGARARDILLQFLVEASTLSIIGGLLGTVLGMGAATALNEFLGWRTLLGIDAILLAVGFSGVIGIFFGYWPARQAARLQPIEALRHE
jgi:putative ABC transport system permease protein